MSEMNDNLWLFDYNQGSNYDAFSKSQDVFKTIDKYLLGHYNFEGKIVLEIGAGSGKFTSFLSEMCSRLLAVEKSASLMQINRTKNHDANNIEFILSDVRDLTMEPNSVDVIFAGWSLTSMRESFDIVFNKLKRVLRKDGIILLVENAGNDEFCKIMGIDMFTSRMKNVYADMGFLTRNIIDATIQLTHKNIFYNAFPNKKEVKLSSLDIQHKVLILEMKASVLQSLKI
jgi:ubiquinone/menaquinone biosynthesis C-methylase UbiE